MPQYKIYFDDGNLQREIARAYEVMAACKQVLQQSRPDTFLGRQSPEPIPLSDDQGEAIIDALLQTSQPDLPHRDKD